MDPLIAIRCRGLLDRLHSQIDRHLPQLPPGGYPQPEAVALDRLPVVASILGEYIQAEAVLASAMLPPEPEPSAEASSQAAPPG